MNKNLKRIGIFLFRDEKGIVDDYVKYLINDMINNLEELYIVVNGVLSKEGEIILKQYTANIIIRPDIGFDVGGWQDAILNYIGFEKIVEYDELILFNDSFFGPLYPFKEVFSIMDQEKIDFWGLSSHGAAPGTGACPYGDRPRYLQTYFLGFRKNLVESEEFQEFWKTLPIFKKFEEVGEGFGCVFTKGFEDLGYKWKAYSDTSDLESEDIRKNMSFHTFNPYDMVARRKFPIVKRKLFITEKDTILRFNYGDELRKTLEYIEKNSNYDLDMIYRYLLRTYNLYDLKNSLNMNCVLPYKVKQGGTIKKQGRAVVIAHLYYPELFDYCIGYLRNIPRNIDIVITIGNEEKKEILQKKCEKQMEHPVMIRKVNERGRDLSALLVGCHDLIKQYEYLCFVHDKKSVQKEYITVGTSFCDLLWENMLKSEEYICNILNTFEKNEILGMLVPPNVYHGTYFWSSTNYWTICYQGTKRLASALGIEAKIEKEKQPVSVGTVFWCKTKALNKLFEFPFEYEDFPTEPLPNDGSISHILERIIPYVAQHHGFLTSTVMNTEYAETEITNFRYMLSNMQNALIGVPNLKFNTYKILVNSIKQAKEEYIQIKQNKKVIEKVVYVEKNNTTQMVPQKIEKEKVIEGETKKSQVVIEQIGLKGAFVNYIINHGWPKLVVKCIRKIVKY